MRKMLRQGDVLLVPVPKVSGERIKPVGGRYILAEGEQTGHHHSVAATPNVATFMDGNRLFLHIVGTTELEHQEHNPLPLEGDYEVVLQRRMIDETRVVQQFD